MSKRIVIIQGHPDPRGGHFGHALADAYARGAIEAGHEVDRIDVAHMDFPLLRSKEEFDRSEPPPAIREAQEQIRQAEHLVLLYPLWLGDLPALFKGFLEQVLRPGFAMRPPSRGQMWQKLLKGRSARVVVTMGMPALVYRWYFGAHSLKLLRRNILGFVGIAPVRSSVVGMVEGPATARRERWLATMHGLGRTAR